MRERKRKKVTKKIHPSFGGGSGILALLAGGTEIVGSQLPKPEKPVLAPTASRRLVGSLSRSFDPAKWSGCEAVVSSPNIGEQQ